MDEEVHTNPCFTFCLVVLLGTLCGGCTEVLESQICSLSKEYSCIPSILPYSVAADGSVAILVVPIISKYQGIDSQNICTGKKLLP